MTNEEIAARIKAARVERGMTQKELAEFLDKTAATLSDIERGKIQVNAADLFIIAQKLSKPIEYFYGEDYPSSDMADLIAMVRSQSKEEQQASIRMLQSMIELKTFMELTEKRGEEPTEAQISSAIEQIINFTDLYEEPFTKIFAFAKMVKAPFKKENKQ